MNKFIEISIELTKLGIVGSASYFFGQWTLKSKWKKESDTQTMKNLIQELPNYDRIKYYFSEISLTDSFKTEVFHQFHDAIENTKSNPSKKFIDSTLQSLIISLAADSRELTLLIGKETFPSHHPGEQTIRRLKYGYPIDDFSTGEKLNAIASKIFEKYNNFLMTAKSKGFSID